MLVGVFNYLSIENDNVLKIIKHEHQIDGAFVSQEKRGKSRVSKDETSVEYKPF